MLKSGILFFFFIQFLAIFSVGQSTLSERGLLFLKNYLPAETHGLAQNWQIIQDQNGWIYVGNGRGVMEYDGSSWRLIPLSNYAVARALGIDKQNRIYVGGLGEIGYLDINEKGMLNYRSLMQYIPESKQDFADVWRVYTTDQGVYFGSNKYIFRWEGHIDNIKSQSDSLNLMRIWSSDSEFLFLATGNDLFFYEKNMGFKTIKGDSLVLVSQHNELNKKRPVLYVLSRESGNTSQRFWVGQRDGQMDFHDGDSINPIALSSELANYLGKNKVLPNSAIELSNGNLTFSTQLGGGIVMNRDGQWVHALNQDLGLVNESIYTMYEDNHQGLWLGTENGIARVEISSPLSFYTDKQGFKGTGQAIIRHSGILFFATGNGLYYLEPTKNIEEVPTFRAISDTVDGWSFVAIDDELLVGSSGGIFLVTTEGVASIADNLPHAYFLYQSPFDSALVYVGFEDGLGIIKKFEDTWKYIGHFQGIARQVRSIIEEQPGNLWLGTSSDGIYQVSIPESSKILIRDWLPKSPPLTDIPIEIQQYGQQHGLPNRFINVYSVDNKTVFTTARGLKKFDPLNQEFIPEISFGKILGDTSCFIYRIEKGENGRISSLVDKNINDPIGRAEIASSILDSNGNYQVIFNQLNRIPSTVIYGFQFIYPDPKYQDVIWLGGNAGVFRYDMSLERQDQTGFPAHIRSVTANEDSLIYYGANRKEFDWKQPILDYTFNSLRFEYSSPFYDEVKEIHYQVFLEGFDKDWSDWTQETKKDYTNLPEGEYQFRVRARNVYYAVSQEGIFTFSIKPPWYRAWWAYLGYTLFTLTILGLSAYFFSKWQNKKLETENEQLEVIISERTKEIKQKHAQLAQTLEHLKKTQEQLILKEKMASLGEMMGGIAHEIKNPLNFVINFAEGSEDLANELKEVLEQFIQTNNPQDHELLYEIIEDIKQNVIDIHSHSKRADKIVNSMVRHAANQRSGNKPTDINYLLHEQIKIVAKNYEVKSENFKVDVKAELEDSLPLINLNNGESNISQVFFNILQNALYAVREKAKSESQSYQPSVLVRTQTDEKYVKITIRDNGVGIPSNIKDKIFTPFFTTKPTGEGNPGLGLSISYDIISLGYQGKLNCESVEGEFTEFEIMLPISPLSS